MSRVLLTGATGFLGMEVLARLLEAGDRDVHALVRAGSKEAAEERLDGVLRKLWRDPAPYRGRVHALPGDLTHGVAAPEEEIDVVCHCAASIAFDLPLDEARAINVEGTREVVGFARECKLLGRLERFLHVDGGFHAMGTPLEGMDGTAERPLEEVEA